MEEIKSFEFKKGVRLFYRYNDNGDIKILYEKQWITIEEFATKYSGVNAYNKQLK